MDNVSNSRRIAKNTLLLYIRMVFMMAVSLLTSRVILDALGEEDFGVYNAVGGVVALFSVLSTPLSNAISRFITFELGTGNKERLSNIFSTAVNIQFLMAVSVMMLCEVVGVWFLNSQMNIPDGRESAANYVLQFSILTFMVNLINIPFNATIIAHERMNVFAYITIFDVSIKLLIAYLIHISPVDKLKLYVSLLFLVSVLLLLIYSQYCKRHFDEAHYRVKFDKQLFREMSSFAGWHMFGNTAYVLNTQGVNMLINIFFGVRLNAARAIAIQVDGAIQQFVNSFTTAINPQITKSYASKEYDYFFKLVKSGTKYTYYIMFLFIVPIVLETDTILSLWLKNVPQDTPIFVRLVVFGSLFTVMGNPMFTAIMATGDIKRYEIEVTLVGCLVFPLTWIAYSLGAPAYLTYVIYIIIYLLLNFIRLGTLKRQINFPVRSFLKDYLLRMIAVSFISFLVPGLIVYLMNQTSLRMLIVFIVSVLWTSLCVYFVGLEKAERVFFVSKAKEIIIRKLFNRV